VIVESPAKAKTIEKYLGKGFRGFGVGRAHHGPCRRTISVWKLGESYLLSRPLDRLSGQEKVVAQLKRAAAKADEIFLAPDPDREGEAIAYHLAPAVGNECKREEEDSPRDL